MEVKCVSGNQVVKNSFWKLCESIGVQVIQLIVTLVLARIIGPEEYGLIALVLVSINFVNLFVTSSLSTYLIYITNIRKQDFFTCLVINILIALLLVIVLYFVAPAIADFYGSEKLVDLIRAMSITVLFTSLSSVYNAYAVKMSQHKRLFIRNMISIPISGAIALIMALTGFGIWSLITQQIIYNVLLAVIIVLTIKIDIDGSWSLDCKVFKPMFAYGGATLLTTFIAFVSDNINDLFIGKKIDAINLGYYNRGNAFPGVIANVLNNLAISVFFPAFSSYKNDNSDLKVKFRKSTMVLYYVCFPIFMGLSVCSEAFVNFILTDKWVGAIPVIQLTCLYYCAMPFLQISSQVFLAIGKLKIRAVGEVVKMVLTIIFLFSFIDYGITAIAVSRVILAFLMVLFSCTISYYYIRYSFIEFIKDVTPPFLLSLFMVACIYPIGMLSMPAFLVLLLQVVVGGIIYLISLRLLKVQEILLLLSIIKKKV